MTFYAINGSPRKNYNTAQLLDSFKKGAESVGENVEVRVVNLYDYTFTGCRECYLCKLKGSKFFGKCGFKDDITAILDEVAHADGIAFGAPIFLGDFSAQMKTFIERLIFPFVSYAGGEFSIAPKKIPTAFFAAMNVTEEFRQAEYAGQMANTVNWISNIFGSQPETCYATNTYQFTDYAKYDAGLWDEAAKRRHREEQFPKDCAKAFEIGRAMAEKAMSAQETKG